jgi:hypothetical protein
VGTTGFQNCGKCTCGEKLKKLKFWKIECGDQDASFSEFQVSSAAAMRHRWVTPTASMPPIPVYAAEVTSLPDINEAGAFLSPARSAGWTGHAALDFVYLTRRTTYANRFAGHSDQSC